MHRKTHAQRVQLLRDTIAQVTYLLTKRGLQVTQRGTQAYVTTDPDTLRPTLINIPYIADSATEDFLSAVQGFLDHEVAHVLFTDWSVVAEANKDKYLSMLHNIVEDTFIERKMSERFPGSRHNLAVLHDYFTKKITTPALNKCSNDKERFDVLFVPIVRAWSGQTPFRHFLDDGGYWKNPVVEAFLNDVPQDLIDRVARVDSSQDALDVARAFDAILRPPQPQSQSQQQSDETSNSSDEDSGEGSSGSSSDDKNDKDDKQDESSNEGSSKSESDDNGDDASKPNDASAGDGDDADNDAGDESAQDERDGSSKDSSDDDANKGDEKSSSGSDKSTEEKGDSNDASDEGDDADDESKSPSSSGDSSGDDDGDDSAVAAASGATSGDTEVPDPQVSDDDKRRGGGGFGQVYQIPLEDLPGDMQEAIAVEIGRDAEIANSQSDYSIYTKDADYFGVYELNPKINREKRNKWRKSLDDSTKRMTNALQVQIERLMAAQSQSVNMPGYRSGRLHTSGLHRIASGDDRVFRRKHVSRSKDTAVSLLVDCSGSMCDDKIATAMQSAYALAQVIDRIGMKCECVGFTTMQAAPYSIGGLDWWDPPKRAWNVLNDGVLMNNGAFTTELNKYSRILPLYMPVFKSFEERVTPAVRDRFAEMAFSNDQRMCTNVDGESVEAAMVRLAQRQEQRRVLIVLSDGMPSGGNNHDLNRHLKRTVQSAPRYGVELIGIGIRSNAVSRFYDNYAVINDVSELPTTVLGELKRVLLR